MVFAACWLWNSAAHGSRQSLLSRLGYACLISFHLSVPLQRCSFFDTRKIMPKVPMFRGLCRMPFRDMCMNSLPRGRSERPPGHHANASVRQSRVLNLGSPHLTYHPHPRRGCTRKVRGIGSADARRVRRRSQRAWAKCWFDMVCVALRTLM